MDVFSMCCHVELWNVATSAPQRDQFLGQIESLRKYLEAQG
jgi:hypothetical protein